MNIQSAISREIFTPRNEKLLVVIEVRKRRKRRLPFLTAGRKRDYVTFLCLSVTNKRPTQVFITKVKQYRGSPRFARRSQWSVEKLRQVDGINPNKNYWEAKLCQGSVTAPGDQKASGTSGDQPMILAAESKKSLVASRPTEFINCQSKLLGDACSFNMVIYRCKIFLNRMKNTLILTHGQPQNSSQKDSTAKVSKPSPSPPAPRHVGHVVRRASQVLSERTEDRPARILPRTKQLSDAAHKMALKQLN
ncbi:syntaxin binding protein 6 (amisyn), like isoform X2 [Electrophorus electricus]|uniref:syntaxin binding protein 6 (amisyn), like isoform X2 n=1 Tax=Electrophorus electricus TaxID=8005 RepID=UPI0015D0739A|nr:syntaxin binding protein 6 (amisyn), like isoform X2 [Electrophorus electricus]